MIEAAIQIPAKKDRGRGRASNLYTTLQPMVWTASTACLELSCCSSRGRRVEHLINETTLLVRK